MELPGENLLRAAIQEELYVELRVASDLLNIGKDLFLKSLRPNPKDPMDHLEAWICLGIAVKACRQYRGIVALAEIALGDVAENIGRMMAETILTAEFLMRPALVLKRDGKPVPEVPGYPLTTAFRTKLYLTHDAASSFKTIREMAKFGYIEPLEAEFVIALAEERAKELANEIGPEWAKRLKDSRTFSGVSVLDLAESIDMLFLYNVFYRPSSSGVHAADANQYIEPEERPDGGITFHALSSGKGIAKSLSFASLVLLKVLNVVNQRFGFGLDERLSDIAPRIQRMKQNFSDENTR